MIAALLKQALDALELCNAEQFPEGIEAMDALQAAIAQPDHVDETSTMVAPPGYQLVPIEPTRAMEDAAIRELGWCAEDVAVAELDDDARMDLRTTYRAMLSAAPQPSVSTLFTNAQAKALATEWHGEAGGELLPQLTADELAGILNQVCIRPAPALLTGDEKKSLQKFAEDIWDDLQGNQLGGFSDGNRPFWLAWKFKEVIEKYGYRDTGLNHSKNALDEAYQRGKSEAQPAIQPLTDFHIDLIFQRYCTKADITPELLAFARGIEEAAHNIKEEKD